MTGRDFARTLISGVEIGRVDEYIGRIDQLPAELADTQACADDFCCAHEIRTSASMDRPAQHALASSMYELPG